MNGPMAEENQVENEFVKVRLETYNNDVDLYLKTKSKLDVAEAALEEFVSKHFHGGSKANRTDYVCFAIPTADVYKLREALMQIRGG